MTILMIIPLEQLIIFSDIVHQLLSTQDSHPLLASHNGPEHFLEQVEWIFSLTIGSGSGLLLIV